MRITLVRHPETVANDQGIIYGKKDYAYTEEGQAQLAWALEKVTSFHVSAIMTSPLKRAMVLAQALAAKCEVELAEDIRLEEMGYGILEGLTINEAQVQYPKVVEAFYAGEEDAPIPHGEGFGAFQARVQEALEDYLSRDQDLMIVSHGGVIRTAIDYLLDSEEGLAWYLEVGNVSFIELEYQDKVCRILNLANYPRETK